MSRKFDILNYANKKIHRMLQCFDGNHFKKFESDWHGKISIVSI